MAASVIGSEVGQSDVGASLNHFPNHARPPPVLLLRAVRLIAHLIKRKATRTRDAQHDNKSDIKQTVKRRLFSTINKNKFRHKIVNKISTYYFQCNSIQLEHLKHKTITVLNKNFHEERTLFTPFVIIQCAIAEQF